MKQRKPVVFDTNILLRAVFGSSSRFLLQKFSEQIVFSTPDVCMAELIQHIPNVSARKKVALSHSDQMLEDITGMLEVIDQTYYGKLEGAARRRIAARDPNDWPILASALLLDCPLWTEDQDFFGTGVATWTTNNVEIYLGQA